MDFKTVIIVIMTFAIVVLVILSVYFIYTSVSNQTKFIDPSKCPKQTTEFGVTPLVVGNKILNSCGTDKVSPCTFQNIGSLNEAINKCHEFANICTSFSYAPGVLVESNNKPQGVMSIVSATDGVSSSSTYDTYTQQIFANLTTQQGK